MLSESGRDNFLSAAREKGQELIADLDVFLTALNASEESPKGKRYGVGVYFFDKLTVSIRSTVWKAEEAKACCCSAADGNRRACAESTKEMNPNFGRTR